MAKLSIKAGTTSKLVHLFVQDSSKTTGAGLAGLTNNSSGLLAHYIRAGESSSNPIAVTSAAIGTWTSGGFIEVEASAMPGLYEFGLPNAVCSANAKSAVLYMFGATNMAPNLSEIELTAVDNQDAVRGGMTALPNANAAAANGLLTSGTGANQISVSAGMTLVQQGAAAGQLDTTSGVVKANMTQTLGVTIPASAGYVAVDWGTVVNKTTSNALTGTTISTSQTIATVTNAVTVGTVNAAASNIKKNTALAGYPFVMTDSTTHAPKTGLTVTGTVSLDGGSFASLTNAVTEMANGYYKVSLAAADLNGNTVALRFTATAADDRDITILTQP